MYFTQLENLSKTVLRYWRFEEYEGERYQISLFDMPLRTIKQIKKLEVNEDSLGWLPTLPFFLIAFFESKNSPRKWGKNPALYSLLAHKWKLLMPEVNHSFFPSYVLPLGDLVLNFRSQAQKKEIRQKVGDENRNFNFLIFPLISNLKLH